MGDDLRKSKRVLFTVGNEDLSFLMQVETLDYLWVAAWFGITIWILTTALAPTYSVLAFLLILRVVARKKSHGHSILYQIVGMAPSVFIGVSLTVYAWNLLNAAAAGTAYTVAQCLTGLALSGLILSGMGPIFNLLMSAGDRKEIKKPTQSWMAFKWINAIWTAAWFGLSIWIFTTWPSYSVSILLLTLRLSGNHNSWRHLWQTALISGAFVGYVTLVENSTNSAPWIAILTMACIALAVDTAALLTKAGVEGWFQNFFNNAKKGRFTKATQELLEDAEEAVTESLMSKMPTMSVPRSGLRKK